MDATYSSMPAPASAVNAGSVLACLGDTLAYRYRWATEGLTDTALGFQPCAGAMDLGTLLGHLRDLAWWLRLTVTGDKADKAAEQVEGLRAETLQWLAEVSTGLGALDEAALGALRIRSRSSDPMPLWNMIHGPMADFLTHVGQVASWRRMAGSPAPSARVFLGLPPEAQAPLASSAPEAASGGSHTVQGEDLAGASYTDVAFTGAGFRDVSFAGAKFEDVTLAGATIHNVDLSNANISDVNLDGLRIDGVLVTDMLAAYARQSS